MKFSEVLLSLKQSDMTMRRYERASFDEFCKAYDIKIDFPFIHVTGSNGKGSVINFLSSIYTNAGYRVGTYLSPYHKSPTETLWCRRKPIDEKEYSSIYEEYLSGFKKYNLSSFERETIVAIKYFQRQKVDLAILECGMGGTLDATNIEGSFPLLAIITSISEEHLKFLGPTIEDVARAKLGILKEGGHLLLGQVSDNLLALAKNDCLKKQATLYQVKDFKIISHNQSAFCFDFLSYNQLSINANSDLMIKNATMAIEAAEILRLSFPFKRNDIVKAMQTPALPGRFERIGPFLLDGAHNPEAICDALPAYLAFSKGDSTLLFASFDDKNIKEELRILRGAGYHVNLTNFNHKRAHDFSLEKAIEGTRFFFDFKSAIGTLLQEGHKRIVICGSLAFVYEVRDYLKEYLDD